MISNPSSINSTRSKLKYCPFHVTWSYLFFCLLVISCVKNIFCPINFFTSIHHARNAFFFVVRNVFHQFDFDDSLATFSSIAHVARSSLCFFFFLFTSLLKFDEVSEKERYSPIIKLEFKSKAVRCESSKSSLAPEIACHSFIHSFV